MLAATPVGNIVAVAAGRVHNFATAVLMRTTKVVRMKLLRYWSEHPTSVGETYLQHCLRACTFGVRLLAGGFACMIHGFLPFLFVHTASKCVAQLHATLAARNAQHSREETLRPRKLRQQLQ